MFFFAERGARAASILLLLSACSGGGGSEEPSEAKLEVTFDPPAGAFVGSQSVTLRSLPGAEIHYTVDGSLPSAASPRYSAPLMLTKSTRLVAQAIIPVAMGAPASALEQRSAVVGSRYLRVAADAAEFSSHLPIALIHTFESGALDAQSDEHVPAMLSIQEPQAGATRVVSRSVLDTPIGIHVRGATSRGFAKKQYAVELRAEGGDKGRARALLGMPAGEDWVFNDAIQMDRSLVRNALAYELSNRIGRYAPRTRFVEAYLVEDGGDVDAQSFVGLFTVMEKIRRGPERINVQALADSGAASELSGGYVLAIDKGDVHFMGAGQSWQFVYPDAALMQQTRMKPYVDFIRTYVEDFGKAINAKDFKHPQTGKSYSAYIDVDAFVDHNILNTLLKNVDALRISAYFFKDRDGLLQAGPLWDFDRSSGTPYDDRAKNPEEWKLAGSDGTDYFAQGFWAALFRDPEFRARYRARFLELLKGKLSPDQMDQAIDGLVANIGAAAARDFARWTGTPAKDGSHKAEVTLLKTFLRRRAVWIQAQLEAGF